MGCTLILQWIFNFLHLSFMEILKQKDSFQHLNVCWAIIIFCSESLISCSYPLWKFKKKDSFKRGLGYNHILQWIFNFLQCSFMEFKNKNLKKYSVQHLNVIWVIIIFCSESLISCSCPLWKFKKKMVLFQHLNVGWESYIAVNI